MKKKYDFNVKDITQKLCLKQGTFYDRIHRGWPIEKAISTPLNTRIVPKRDRNKTHEESFFNNLAVSDIVDFSPLGGWRINILNKPKCQEYKFQAYNTITGEFLKSNNSEEIKRIAYKIFTNI